MNEIRRRRRDRQKSVHAPDGRWRYRYRHFGAPAACQKLRVGSRCGGGRNGVGSGTAGFGRLCPESCHRSGEQASTAKRFHFGRQAIATRLSKAAGPVFRRGGLRLQPRSGDTTFSDAHSRSFPEVRSSGTCDANRSGQLRRIETRRRDSNPQPLHPLPCRQSRKQSALPLSYVASRPLDRCEPCIEIATGFVDAFSCQTPKSG
jgi:hypothetical protein